jgi:hypothetical protein
MDLRMVAPSFVTMMSPDEPLHVPRQASCEGRDMNGRVEDFVHAYRSFSARVGTAGKVTFWAEGGLDDVANGERADKVAQPRIFLSRQSVSPLPWPVSERALRSWDEPSSKMGYDMWWLQRKVGSRLPNDARRVRLMLPRLMPANAELIARLGRRRRAALRP